MQGEEFYRVLLRLHPYDMAFFDFAARKMKCWIVCSSPGYTLNEIIFNSPCLRRPPPAVMMAHEDHKSTQHENSIKTIAHTILRLQGLKKETMRNRLHHLPNGITNIDSRTNHNKNKKSFLMHGLDLDRKP
jgi:hypothetical protein